MWAIEYHVHIDRCCCSPAAVTPVRYEWDSRNVAGTFVRSKIFLVGKLTNRALVTPTPDNGCGPMARSHYLYQNWPLPEKCHWKCLRHQSLKWVWKLHIDGLVQERCNSSALAMELHLSCINPSISYITAASPRVTWGIVLSRTSEHYHRNIAVQSFLDYQSVYHAINRIVYSITILLEPYIKVHQLLWCFKFK